MTDLRPLQEGRLRRSALIERRRRARRRRIAWRGLLAFVVAAIVLLVLFEPATSRNALPRITQSKAAPARPRTIATPVYGRVLASATLRRRVRRALKGNAAVRAPLRSGLLFDVRSGRVLWEREPDRRLPIASLTKMMTALVVAADDSGSGRVLVTRQALDYSGSGVGMLPLGKRVPERALLYGLLLPSGNDAAIALAQHVAGTRPRFVAMMNARARAMGLRCTHYTTVSGVVDRHNYSCAADLAVIAHAVLSTPLLARIVASPTAALKFPIKGGRLFLTNNNPLLLGDYPGTDGVKTGYTAAAGLCLVATVRRGPEWLGVVLLHSENWTTQAEALLNAGFAATAPRARRPGA
jgi:serine-type D-Ala-D-Ala carboxypeptidase (penicillin-binding protein 5/6)